eukprot:9466421-Pyramimonas_sp.AAC.1
MKKIVTLLLIYLNLRRIDLCCVVPGDPPRAGEPADGCLPPPPLCHPPHPTEGMRGNRRQLARTRGALGGATPST